jgi:hypothetical protein
MDLLHRPLGIRAPDPLKFCFAYAKYRPEDDSQVTFSCDGPRGALLSLPVSAQSEDTVALDKFGKWMITHINAWFAFTQSLGMGVEKMEDIILVTGRHLTKSWIMSHSIKDAEMPGFRSTLTFLVTPKSISNGNTCMEGT